MLSSGAQFPFPLLGLASGVEQFEINHLTAAASIASAGRCCGYIKLAEVLLLGVAPDVPDFAFVIDSEPKSGAGGSNACRPLLAAP